MARPNSPGSEGCQEQVLSHSVGLRSEPAYLDTMCGVRKCLTNLLDMFLLQNLSKGVLLPLT